VEENFLGINQSITVWPFAELGMPDRYTEVASSFLGETQTALDDRLLMFMVTGSCALKQCVDGFSDIDALIVTDKFNFADLKTLRNSTAVYDISIAVEALSRHQVERRMFDDKTKFAFYQMSSGLIAPNYIQDGSSLTLPDVELSEIQEDDKLTLPWQLDRVGRLLYEPSDNKRMAIKHLYTIMKMRLRSLDHGIVATSYAETFKRFAQEFGEEEFDIMAEIASNQPMSEEFVTFARRVTERVSNGEL
jgi:hypothetical protein